MGITMGSLLFWGGIAGAAVCVILLLASWKIFEIQRKKMIEFLEKL